MAPAQELSAPVTFEAAMQLTQTLLSHMETGDWSEVEIETTIAQLICTLNGARGFFVVYLTDNRDLSDRPSPAVIRALQSSPEMVSTLMVKNLAMSTAQALSHQRQQNLEMAQASVRVTRRVINLIQQMQLPAIQAEAQHLQNALTTGAGAYDAFLNRWQYDAAQRQAIQEAVGQILAP